MQSFRDFLSSGMTPIRTLQFWLKNYRAIRETIDMLRDLFQNGSEEDKIRFGIWHLKLLSGDLKPRDESQPINRTITKSFGRRFPF